MLVLALLQAAVAGPLLDKPRAPARACGTTAPDGSLIVCGAGQEGFRLRPLPERYAADPAALPKAETGILGGKAKLAAEAEQAGVGGVVSNRAMVRLKTPF
ncbi:hypothetical protein ASG29_13135 [Sphingomonas sp. Leaf412]|uniref:hypothetical protein n=1 Tax=Sphingomonas sp. Leaf412 TaxID=1736370 RepID=UPI0006F41E7D|nr:hypothetical protein [Sphingomonas sp. Leaf412]KQT32675.1 hypothetical protein ASG29_13135 [Sphingomonas sp. Leaf412]